MRFCGGGKIETKKPNPMGSTGRLKAAADFYCHAHLGNVLPGGSLSA